MLTDHRLDLSVITPRELGTADARIIQDAEGRILGVDTAGSSLYGWSTEDLVGTQAPMLVHPDDRDIVRKVRTAVRSTARSQSVQIRVRMAGGRWLWVECAFSALPEHDGRAPRYTELELRDVSARYLRDEALALLVDIRSLLDNTDSFEDALRRGLRRLGQWGGFDAAAAWQRGDSAWRRHVMVSCSQHRQDATSILPPERARRIAAIANVAEDQHSLWIEDTHGASTLLVPVVSAHETVAVLELVGDDTTVIEGAAELVFEVAKQLGDVIRRRRVEAELEIARQYFALAFNEAAIGMAVVGTDGRFLDANTALCRLLGRDRDQLRSLSFQHVTHPDDLDAGLELNRRVLDGSSASAQMEKRYLHADGSVIWGLLSVSLVRDEHGTPLHFISQIQDITQRKAAEAELERTVEELAVNERRYRSLVEPSVDIIARIGIDGRVEDLNHQAALAIGDDPTNIVGRHLRDLLPSPLADAMLDRVSGVAATGCPDEMWREWLEPVNRAPGWFVIRLMPEAPAEESGYVEHVHLMATDITELVESEQRLSEMALVDTLTGLSNRVATFDRLQHALDRLDRRPGTGVAVAVVDLDHFKTINDTYGHAIGDDAICAAGEALQRAVRADDTVGRMGGDEFIVVFEDVMDRDNSCLLGQRLHHELSSASVTLPDGGTYPLSGSVGVAYTDAALPMNELIARADRAMYEAKRHGRDCSWVDPRSGVIAGHAPVS